MTQPDPLRQLMAALDHDFGGDPGGLLREALTHRSYVNEADDRAVRDNERLEFLGDAVIDLIVAQELMRRFPDAREGVLSRLRASLVSEAGLAGLARRLELGQALRLGRGELSSGGREKASILSDAAEAVFAALFLDAGLDKARAALVAHLELPDTLEGSGEDPKTALQHRVQAEWHKTPRYRLLDEQGPGHDKRFFVEVWVEGEGDALRAAGEGRTKKEAEQHAAQALLDRSRRP